MEGLLLDAIGAIIVVGGDWSPARPYFIPGQEIERIRSGKDRVIKGENIEKSDEGFEEIRSIICDKVNIVKKFPDDESKEDRPIKESEVIRFDVTRGSKTGFVNFGGGDKHVYPVWEDDEWSQEELDKRIKNLSEGASLPNHVYTPEERLDSVGSPSLIDEWIDQRLRRLENSAKQTALNIGLSFFVLGFSIQAIAQL